MIGSQQVGKGTLATILARLHLEGLAQQFMATGQSRVFASWQQDAGDLPLAPTP